MELDIIVISNLIGSIAFALSGFLAGVRKHLDAMGIFIVSMLTANGGGALRDVLINKVPLVLQDSTPFLLSVAVIFAGWLFGLHRRANMEQHRIFVLCDAIGLVAFALTGTMAGLAAGLPVFGVTVLAFLTAAGGGMLRDVLVGDVPSILKSDFYGTVAILVALVMCGLDRLQMLDEAAIAVVAGTALCLRLLAYAKGWQLPRLNGK